MAKFEYFYDDFASFDTEKWWKTSESTGIVTGGHMRLVPTAGYDYVESAYSWDLHESHVAVQFTQNANAGLGSISTTFTVDPDGSWNNNVEFEISGGSTGVPIYCGESVGGSYTQTSFAYNPLTHIWFRIRLTSGTMYWETSADGVAWTVQRSKSTSLSWANAAVRFVGAFWDSETAPGHARIDNFNLYAGIPPRPPTSSITDDFATLDENKWIVLNDATVTGGNLRIGVDDEFNAILSTDICSLEESFISMEMKTNNPAGETYLTDFTFISPDNNNRVAFFIGGPGGYVECVESIGGVNSSVGFLYSSLRHIYFRIRETGGTVYWETSIDGAYWTTRREKTTTLDLSQGQIRLSSGYYGTEPDSFILVDNLNLVTGNEIGPEIPFKAELLTDTFDFFDDLKWYRDEELEWEVIDGKLVGDSMGYEYNYIVSIERWDLRDSHFMAQLVQNNNVGTAYPGNATAEFVAKLDNANQFKFIIEGGEFSKITLREIDNGVIDDTFGTYNPARHKWFRLREAGGEFLWEVSENSIIWTILRRKSHSMDLSNIQFLGTCGHWDEEETDAGVVIWDNFNLPDLKYKSLYGWNVGNHLPFGSFDGGTVQARNVFPKADWLWTPIPDNPVLDPQSEQIGALLGTPGGNHSISWGWYSNGFVNAGSVLPDTPRYQINWLGKVLYPDWFDYPNVQFPHNELVPIPYGTQVPPGSDGHLVVADPVSRKVFSFWQAWYDSDEDKWYAAWGGVADMDGDGRDYSAGSTATGLSRYAGVARVTELLAGEVPHALFVASNMCAPGAGGSNPYGFRYPAKYSDGTNFAGVSHPVEQGSRLQLNPEIDLESIVGITPIELALGRAWQKYGAYVGDSGGRPSPPGVQGASVELDQGFDYFPYNEYTVVDDGEGGKTFEWREYDPDFYPPVPPAYAQLGVGWDYFALNSIPWEGNIRVLKNWHGGN